MIVAGLALMLMSTPPQTADDGFRPAEKAYSFTVELPAGAVLTRREILDFDLYRVEADGRPILNFYEGFAANVTDWVQDRKAPDRQQRLLEGQPVEYFWNRQCDGWANEVHAWILADTPPEAAVEARRIADTLVMRPCVNTP
jgi:hypothetical protein